MEPAEADNIPLIIGDLRRCSIHVLQPFHQSRHLEIYPQPKRPTCFGYSRFGGRAPLVFRDEDAWPIFAYRPENTLCWQNLHLANGFYPRSQCSFFANTSTAILVIELATNKDLVRAGKPAGENLFFFVICRIQVERSGKLHHRMHKWRGLLSGRQIPEETLSQWQLV